MCRRPFGEQRASAREVGLRFLDDRDGVLTHSLELRRELAHVIRGHRPGGTAPWCDPIFATRSIEQIGACEILSWR